MYLNGNPNNGVYNPVNIDVYRYAQNKPIMLIDPNGMWEDKSIRIGYEDKGVQKEAQLNMGTVTEGDTLVKLAEMQLKAETGSVKFSGKDVEKKVAQIKQMNNLKSDTIRVGQNLILGASNERVVGEQGIQQSNVDLLLMGGVAYGLTRAGIAGAGMLAEVALATETGIKLSLYGGLLAYAARSGLQNGTLIPYAIQSIPGIGNMMLRYGPQINKYGGAFISGYMPSGTSTFRNLKEAGLWILGNWLGLKN